MAKDLPYFKFKVNDWLTGDITACSLEAQGLFTNMCAMYWSRGGKLESQIFMKRYTYSNLSELMDELVGMNIISLKNGLISISFLNEQLWGFENLSKTNSNNVSKRWKKPDSDTTVSSSYDSGNTKSYNIEERRGEETREDTISFDVFWDAYGKKVGRAKSEIAWNKLSSQDKAKIMVNLPLYRQREVKFRKDPERYLKHKTWEDQIVDNNSNLPNRPL